LVLDNSKPSDKKFIPHRNTPVHLKRNDTEKILNRNLSLLVIG